MQINYREAKLKLVQVFQDTLKMCKENEILKDSIQNSIQQQKIYPQEMQIECNKNRFSQNVKITVSTKRTFEAAKNYSQIDENQPSPNTQKICVLNFANSVHVGGGVIHGARAQEECLCRISTLYPAISDSKPKKNFYEKHLQQNDFLGTDDIIYTPNVTVFKSDTDIPEVLEQKDWFTSDVITCAAPCLYDLEKPLSEQELYALHLSRWKKILTVACKNDVDTLILGAFGCGAFGNPPELVAKACKEALKDFENTFVNIEFAVFCTPNKMENFESFKRVFGKGMRRQNEENN